jgi:hypothetical protein
MPYAAQAQEEDLFDTGVDIMGDVPTDIPQSNASKDTLSEFLMHKMPLASARNINKAEKVYCYTVEYAPNEYDGYLMDDLAVKGSCGELSAAGQKLIKDALFQNSIIYSNSQANCQIAPKIMLRYVYGLDYTDVLLSYPCPSLTIFHGRDTTILNAAPGGAVVDQLVTAYSKLEEKFYSPALLGQMVANGQPQTQAQKEMIRLNAPTEAPRKKWDTETPAATQPTQPQQPAKSGWNRLK